MVLNRHWPRRILQSLSDLSREKFPIPSRAPSTLLSFPQNDHLAPYEAHLQASILSMKSLRLLSRSRLDVFLLIIHHSDGASTVMTTSGRSPWNLRNDSKRSSVRSLPRQLNKLTPSRRAGSAEYDCHVTVTILRSGNADKPRQMPSSIPAKDRFGSEPHTDLNQLISISTFLIWERCL